MTEQSILDLVELHSGFITAKIAVGCDSRKYEETFLDYWIWDVPVTYTTFEVIDNTHWKTPYVRVLGFRTNWGSN